MGSEDTVRRAVLVVLLVGALLFAAQGISSSGPSAGVFFEKTWPGETSAVTVHSMDMDRADRIRIVTDGSTVATLTTVGDSATVVGLDPGDEVVAVADYGDTSTALTTYRVGG